jgi:hypothetical protein
MTPNRRPTRSRPLIVAITDLPLFYQAVAGSLREFATVHALAPAGGDTSAVLRAINPDAVIVDNARDARAAAEAAREAGIRVIHLSPDESVLRLFDEEGWTEHGLPPMASEAFEGVLRITALGTA